MDLAGPIGSVIRQRGANIFDQPAPGNDEADDDIADYKDVKCLGCHKIHVGLRADEQAWATAATARLHHKSNSPYFASHRIKWSGQGLPKIGKRHFVQFLMDAIKMLVGHHVQRPVEFFAEVL